MYLSKVKLFGFKSFAKKTDIVFDEGITAIVGPNGCGKSNVVDAIRWVLGEQRVSSLRSDKMESVIFSGSDSKKPLGMAEVSLLIENTKNILPTEYSEVEVKRRIYRSGESEYLLNNVPCKLKDIITLFMDTGMGSDAYSLIELPMIEQIISDKTEDRRRLFEEASGITKYKKRRNEAFRRLEDTRQDLLRVNDIIIEVERKVNSLKRQAAKVRRYQKLKDELKIKEHELLKSTLYSIKLKNEPLASNINQLKNCQGTAKGELIKKEADLEKLKSDLVVHENSLSGVQTEYNSIVDILNSQQMELALSKEKNHSIHEQIKKIESEEKELTRKISDNLLALKENKEKLAILERNVNDITDEQKQAEEKLSGFYVEYYDKKNRLSTAQTKIVELIEKYSEEGRKQDKMLLDLRQKEEKLSSMVKESTFIKERLSNKESILKSLLTERKRIENFLDEKRKYCSKMEGEVEAKRIMLSELKEKKMDFTKQVEIDSKKIDFLYQIISEAGKLSEGTEHLLKEKDSIVGLLGTVGELIKTDEKYEKALLGSLKNISNFLIFDTADNGFKALKMLAERASGEVDIIPLDKISKLDAPPKINLDNSDINIIGCARDFVTCDERVRKIADFLFYDVFITEESIINRGFSDSVSLHGITLTDLSGMTIDKFGFVHTAGDSKEENISTKLTEIEKIKKNIEKTKREHEKMLGQEERYEKEVQILTEKIDNVGIEISSQEKRLHEIENEISVSEFDVKKDKEHLARMERERKQLEIFTADEEMLEKQKTELKVLKDEQSRLHVEIEKLRLQEEEIEQTRKQFEGIVHEKNLQVIQFQEERKRVEIDYRRNIELDDEYKRNIEKGKEIIVTLNEEIAGLVEKVEKIQSEIEEYLKSKIQFEEKMNTLKADQADCKNKVFEEEKSLKEMRAENEKRTNDIFSLEIKKTNLEQEEKRLVELLGDDSGGISEEDKLSETDVEIKKKRIEDLNNKLDDIGQINFAAIDEYNEEKERYDNLFSQRDDIIEAEKTLMETINKINKTAREKFVQTFEKIRNNLKDIYGHFFEKGEADLLLTDSPDPLESKIMIVSKPGGKKLQSISLLSAGEKALTAIALLLAIYKVKPSPFCVLDEIDAPLDDANIERFLNVLELFSKDTQFIVVTHNKKTMQASKYIYGITMEEDGVSKVVSTKFN